MCEHGSLSVIKSFLTATTSLPPVNPIRETSSCTSSASSSPVDSQTRVQAKKKATFDAWLRRKLEQIDTTPEDDEESGTTGSESVGRVSVLVKRPSQQSSIGSSIKDSPPLKKINSAPIITAEPDSASPSTSLLQALLNTLQEKDRCSPASLPSGLIGTTLNAASASRDLTTPKLSRHNDAAYYPNIQCILCREWVCSRNRYMHIESHLQYRPYKCSVCGYDNRKEIFINLHIKKVHLGNAQVSYTPDQELEHRAWLLAEQCLQHTREILVQEGNRENSDMPPPLSHDPPPKPPTPKPVSKNTKPASPMNQPKLSVETSLLEPYAQVYRPKIYNTQRIEKSHLIEESRLLGLVPDFSEVAERETRCGLCTSHVLSHHSVLEEHVRNHLSRPSYRCNIDGCKTEHNSKNFLTRHMKEVHKHRRPPFDILEIDAALLTEFGMRCHKAFPVYFVNDRAAIVRHGTRVGRPPGHPSSIPLMSSPPTPATSLQAALSRPSPSLTQEKPQSRSSDRQQCRLCLAWLAEDYGAMYSHIKSHLSLPPYGCHLCSVTSIDRGSMQRHTALQHKDTTGKAVHSRMTIELAQQSNLLMIACFPNVPLQPTKHDPIVNSL